MDTSYSMGGRPDFEDDKRDDGTEADKNKNRPKKVTNTTRRIVNRRFSIRESVECLTGSLESKENLIAMSNLFLFRRRCFLFAF